jgi:hypothetical protein
VSGDFKHSSGARRCRPSCGCPAYKSNGSTIWRVPGQQEQRLDDLAGCATDKRDV